jgi:NAD(P)-dependent dehydrogenase (short-subunit alcohol dehydrogenase family)
MDKSLFDLNGTTALIAGGSRGIGFAIARQFLAQGADVMISGHDPAETKSALEKLTTEFCSDSGRTQRVAAIAGDVTNPALAHQLVAEAILGFGRLDSVVCNAGIDVIRPAVDYGVEEWDRVLSVNLKGAFLVAQSAARAWIERGQRGVSISITSSVAGSVGIATLAPYAASKGGVNQLVRTLAVEWAPHGIRVNAVAPGYVDNAMAGVHTDAAAEERIRRCTPLGRRASVEEIAGPYVFLASSAATYVTGAILAVDGGYTAL